MTKAEIYKTKVQLMHDMNKWCIGRLSAQEMKHYWWSEEGIPEDLIEHAANTPHCWILVCQRFGKVVERFNEEDLA